MQPLFPLGDQLKSYPGSVNVDLSHPGRIAPAFDHAPLSGSADVLHYFSSQFVETTDANGNPIAFAAANLTVWKIQNGTISVDTTFSSGGVIQDIQMVDNGTGTRVLMVVFGIGGPTGTAGNATRNMTSGAWTNNAGVTFLLAYHLRSCSDQLGAATGSAGTGRAALIERKFAICPSTSDPTLAASWSTAQPVWDDPTWQINGVAAFEDRFCIGGPPGFFIRDQQEGRWKNMTQHVRPHGVNGKLTVAGENCVWFGTRTELFQFDGRQMWDRTPFRDIERPRDMPQGRVTMLVDNGNRGVAVLECWPDILEGVHAANAGLRVFKEVNAVITELTSSVLDSDMSTQGSMSGWGATTDYLVFGFPRPLESLGVRVLLTASANTATQSFTAPQCLNGAGSWVSLGTIRDASVLSVAGKSLQVTGFPASAGESVINWDAIDGISKAGSDTYNGISGMYWYRVTKATGNAMTASGTAGITEAFCVVARPGLPNSGLLTQSTNFTPRFRAGGISRVLEFIRQGGNIIWQDKYHLDTGGGVFCGGFTASPMAGGDNSGPRFVLLGRFRQMYVMEGKARDATQQKYARLAQITATEPAPILAVYNLMLGDPEHLRTLKTVTARGVFVQESDAIQLVVQADENIVYDLGVRYGTQAEWDCSKVGEFWRCHLFFVLKDTTQFDPATPYWQFFSADAQDTTSSPYKALSFPVGVERV
jgi:hypothetical protein